MSTTAVTHRPALELPSGARSSASPSGHRPWVPQAAGPIGSDHPAVIPAMGPANRAPGVPIMGRPDSVDRTYAMGIPDAGWRPYAMGAPDAGPRSDLMGVSDLSFVDWLFHGRRGDHR